MTNYQVVETTRKEDGQEQRANAFRVTQFVWWVVGILEALIALRVIFKLIGVNGENTVAAMLYGTTEILVAPFVSLVGSPSAGGMALEISSIIAMIAYFFFGWAITRLLELVLYRPRGPVSVSQTTVVDQTPITVPVITQPVVVTETIDTGKSGQM